MKTALFLGAGASVSFNKPITSKLKDIIYSKYNGQSFNHHIIRSLLGVPEFKDIEHVLQAVEDVIDFSKKTGGKFFSNIAANTTLQHQMLAYKNMGYTYQQIVDELYNIYKILTDEIFKNYSWDPSDNANLLTIYNKIFDIIKNEHREIFVFTTNYDQAIEQYCEINSSFHCIDGFKHDIGKKRYVWANGDYLPASTERSKIPIYLHKLHGSLNWKRRANGEIEYTSEEGKISDLKKYNENILIYPTVSPKKGETVEPYKTIRKRFENYMKAADMCIVVGFSFRDEHINKIFNNFIHNKKSLVCVSPTASENIANISDDLASDVPAISDNDVGQFKKYSNVYYINKPISPSTVKEACTHIENTLYVIKKAGYI